MGKLKGFVEYDRTDEKYLSVTERLKKLQRIYYYTRSIRNGRARW